MPLYVQIKIITTMGLKHVTRASSNIFLAFFVHVAATINETSEVTPILNVDAIGAFTLFMDRVISQFTRGSPTPTEGSCKSFILNVGGSEFTVTNHPRGYCPYCCTIQNPSEYVSIYFTRKSLRGKIVKIKMAAKPGALRALGVDPNLPTIIYTHGFTENGLGLSARSIRDAYLSRPEEYNIFTVSWSILAAFPWYSTAVKNTKVVSTLLAKFLSFYDDTGELPISNIHLIGFSLGSHISGFTAKFLRSKQKVPRITGLDPAFPQFSLTDTFQRLSKFDADYVDIIHSDGGIYGFPVSIGHADFYPNGGKLVQPGCEPSTLAKRNSFDEIVLCNHFHAWRFYAESVRNPMGFPATKCGILENGSLRRCNFTVDAYMGFLANKRTTLGNFYLTTNGHSPYARSVAEQQSQSKGINLIL